MSVDREVQVHIYMRVGLILLMFGGLFATDECMGQCLCNSI